MCLLYMKVLKNKMLRIFICLFIQLAGIIYSMQMRPTAAFNVINTTLPYMATININFNCDESHVAKAPPLPDFVKKPM